MSYFRGNYHSDAFAAVRAVNNLTILLDNIIRGRNCILLDWPAYPNVGDHLIWLGAKIILKKYLGLSVKYQSSYLNADIKEIEKHFDSVIVFTGGGNFGDLYIHHQKFREDIATKFADRDVIFLPQTIEFTDQSNLENTRRILNPLKNLSIFTRDVKSWSISKTFVESGNSHLAIDCAFALISVLPRILKSMPPCASQPIYLMRRDREAVTNDMCAPSDALVIDWIAEDSLDWILSDADTRYLVDDLELFNIIDEEWEYRSLEHLIRAVYLFGRASYVVTDRLHAHILALLLGVKCRVIDNSYGKNSAFVHAWTCDDPIVSSVNF